MTERTFAWFHHAASNKQRPAIVLAIDGARAVIAYGTGTLRNTPVATIAIGTRQYRHLQLTKTTYFYVDNIVAVSLQLLAPTPRLVHVETLLKLREAVPDAMIESMMKAAAREVTP